MTNINCVFSTERTYPCSCAAVFAAFAEPERLAVWWGPNGFTNTFTEFKFVPNGRWQFVMHGPDGTDYSNECEFIAIEPYKSLHIRHLNAPEFTLAINLSTVDGGCLLAWRQTFDDPQVAQAVKAIVEPANEQNLARLHRHLQAFGDFA
jgi:uncharacterized protein YndB with AHSA1/START domain